MCLRRGVLRKSSGNRLLQGFLGGRMAPGPCGASSQPLQLSASRSSAKTIGSTSAAIHWSEMIGAPPTCDEDERAPHAGSGSGVIDVTVGSVLRLSFGPSGVTDARFSPESNLTPWTTKRVFKRSLSPHKRLSLSLSRSPWWNPLYLKCGILPGR